LYFYIDSNLNHVLNNLKRCLKHGLLNPNTTLSKEEENEYNLYNKTREAALESCHKQCELYKFDMRAASNEEASIFKEHSD